MQRVSLAIVLTIIMGALAGVPAAAATSAAPIKDTWGDVRSPRGDLTAVSVEYSDTAITATFRVARRTSPYSPNWQYSDYSWAELLLDTDGNGYADHSVRYMNDSQDRLDVRVLKGRTWARQPLCWGRGGYRDGQYRFSFHPRCIGNPSTVQYRLRLLYHTDASDPRSRQTRDWAPNRGWSAKISDPTPMAATYVRMQAPASEIAFGESVELVGSIERQSDSRMMSGQVLQLYARLRGDSEWELVESKTSGMDGSARFTHAPVHNTEYQIRHPGSDHTLPHKSGVPLVKVAFVVDTQVMVRSVEAGEDVIITGVARPRPPDEFGIVLYSSRDGGPWEEEWDAYVDEVAGDGSFEMRWDTYYAGPGDYEIRVGVEAGSENNEGHGPTHAVTVTAPPDYYDEW